MKRPVCLLLSTFAFTCVPDPKGLTATELLRGPYLQAASPTSITIRWRTDQLTSSVVFYGTGTSEFMASSDARPTTEHIVRVTGLTPGTTYHYSVGTALETLAEGPECKFVTPPVSGTPAPTRVWVTGDTGSYSYGGTNVLAMRDAYLTFNGARHTDVWLPLGDNAYEDGTDAEYQTNFFEVFSTIMRQVTPWPTIGNHEVFSSTNGSWFPYLSIFTFPIFGEAGGVPSGTLKYYSFDHANIHFICLDAMSESRATNSPMAEWLRADLAATTNQWKIAYWHHPPYTKGTHDSDYEIEMVEMRENILPILESFGTDLVLSGHSHSYERSVLLQGHYGNSTTFQPAMALDAGTGREADTGPYLKSVSGPLANLGTVYLVVGNSAWAGIPVGHHPAMIAEDIQIGSVVLDINTNRLDATFLRADGVVGDTFTIIKGDREVDPLRILTFGVDNGQAVISWNSVSGRTYQVQGTESLQTPNWQPIGSDILGVDSTSFWTNAVNPVLPTFFYRVAQTSP